MLALAAPAAAAAKGPPRGFYGLVPQGGLSASDYSRLAGAKVGTLRVEFSWASVQGGNGACNADGSGSCNWGGIDGLVYAAATAGVRVFPTFYGSPQFISKHHNNAPTKGSDLKNWRQFVAAAVARYGRNGTLLASRGPLRQAPQERPDHRLADLERAELEASSGTGIRSRGRTESSSRRRRRRSQRADRKADIVLAGMYGYAKQPAGQFPRELYRVKGIERYFDSLAIHPYSPTVAGIKKQVHQARSAARRGGRPQGADPDHRDGLGLEQRHRTRSRRARRARRSC